MGWCSSSRPSCRHGPQFDHKADGPRLQFPGPGAHTSRKADFGTAAMTTLLITTNAVPTSLQRDSDSDGTPDTIVSNMGGTVTGNGRDRKFHRQGGGRFRSTSVQGLCPSMTSVPVRSETGIVSVGDGTGHRLGRFDLRRGSDLLCQQCVRWRGRPDLDLQPVGSAPQAAASPAPNPSG